MQRKQHRSHTKSEEFVFLEENNFLSFEKANGKQFETIVSFGVQNDVATSLLMWRHIRMKFSDVAT